MGLREGGVVVVEMEGWWRSWRWWWWWLWWRAVTKGDLYPVCITCKTRCGVRWAGRGEGLVVVVVVGNS